MRSCRLLPLLVLSATVGLAMGTALPPAAPTSTAPPPTVVWTHEMTDGYLLYADAEVFLFQGYGTGVSGYVYATNASWQTSSVCSVTPTGTSTDNSAKFFPGAPNKLVFTCTNEYYNGTIVGQLDIRAGDAEVIAQLPVPYVQNSAVARPSGTLCVSGPSSSVSCVLSNGTAVTMQIESEWVFVHGDTFAFVNGNTVLAVQGANLAVLGQRQFVEVGGVWMVESFLIVYFMPSNQNSAVALNMSAPESWGNAPAEVAPAVLQLFLWTDVSPQPPTEVGCAASLILSNTASTSIDGWYGEVSDTLVVWNVGCKSPTPPTTIPFALPSRTKYCLLQVYSNVVAMQVATVVEYSLTEGTEGCGLSAPSMVASAVLGLTNTTTGATSNTTLPSAVDYFSAATVEKDKLLLGLSASTGLTLLYDMSGGTAEAVWHSSDFQKLVAVPDPVVDRSHGCLVLLSPSGVVCVAI